MRNDIESLEQKVMELSKLINVRTKTNTGGRGLGNGSGATGGEFETRFGKGREGDRTNTGD